MDVAARSESLKKVKEEMVELELKARESAKEEGLDKACKGLNQQSHKNEAVRRLLALWCNSRLLGVGESHVACIHIGCSIQCRRQVELGMFKPDVFSFGRRSMRTCTLMRQFHVC